MADGVKADKRVVERLGATALVIAGLLQAIGSALHPDDTAATAYFFDPRWAPAHVALALSFLFAVFGLMGLFAEVSDKVGPLGVVGWTLAVCGCILLVGVTFAEAFLLPVIAANRPAQPLAQWLDPAGPLAGAVVVSLASLFCFDIGFVVLGVSVEYARMLPRHRGLLLAASTVLSNGEFLGPIGFVVYVGSGIALGLTLVWWGSALLMASRESTGTKPEPKVA